MPVPQLKLQHQDHLFASVLFLRLAYTDFSMEKACRHFIKFYLPIDLNGSIWYK